MQDDVIQSIPRKPRKQRKAKKAKVKVSFNQTKCDHIACNKFRNEFTDVDVNFEEWIADVRQQFKTMNHQQQLQFASTMIHFKRPQKSKDRKRWQQDGASMRYEFPKSYKIELPCPGGWGVHLVCGQYFRYVFAFGKTRFRTIMAEIWMHRRLNKVLIEKETTKPMGQEEPWIKKVEQYLIRYKKLSKSHYIDDKEIVYIDSEAHKKQDWQAVYDNYIEFDQPQSFDNWIKKTGAQDQTIPKPKPCYRHFLRVIPKRFQCQPKRMAKDRCNGCQHIKMLLGQAQSADEQQRLNDLSSQHLHRASVCYQLNSHFKNFSNQSFNSRSIDVVRLQNPEMKYPDTYVHYEIDYDVDHPECVSNLNMAYFKSKIGMKTANVIQSPPDEFGSRKVYGWSGMHGGKAVEETTQCLEHCFKKRSIGAERCGITLDGALLTYKLLQFAAFSVHSKNPNRYFRSIVILSPETGHSRLEADTINAQAKSQYAKRSQFSTCEERLNYLDDSTNIETHQFTRFAMLPTIFEILFIEPSKKALIRDDKGIMYEFGESKVWNSDTKKFEWTSHEDELWIRCDEDLKQDVRKLKIFTNKINEFTEEQLKTLHRPIKAAPSIKKRVLQDTLEIAKMMSNCVDLVDYFTPTTIDETGEVKYIHHVPKYGKITTKLNRRNQFKSMLRTKEVIQLEKYPRKNVVEEKVEDCDIEKLHSISDIRNILTTKELKIELKNHGQKVSGRKTELQLRLINHYEFHDS